MRYLYLCSLFIFSISWLNPIFAAENHKRKSSLSISTQDGDRINNITIHLDADNQQEVISLLDSILDGSGHSFKAIKKQFDKLKDIEPKFYIDSLIQALGQTNKSDRKVVLGIAIENNDSDTTVIQHPEITRVITNSPADHAGLKKGDMLLDLDGQPVENFQEVTDKIQSKSSGDSLHITYLRNQDTLSTIAILKSFDRDGNWLSWIKKQFDSMNDTSISDRNNPFCNKIVIQKSRPRLGVKVRDLDSEARKSLRVKRGGALVTQVFNRSTAQSMGLKLNDVIVSIDKHNVQNVSDLKELIDNLKVPHEVVLKYKRYGKKRKTKGIIDDYSRAWEENQPLNIIDISNNR